MSVNITVVASLAQIKGWAGRTFQVTGSVADRMTQVAAKLFPGQVGRTVTHRVVSGLAKCRFLIRVEIGSAETKLGGLYGHDMHRLNHLNWLHGFGRLNDLGWNRLEWFCGLHNLGRHSLDWFCGGLHNLSRHNNLNWSGGLHRCGWFYNET